MILWRRTLVSCCVSYAQGSCPVMADTKETNDASSMVSMLAQGERILQTNILKTL